MKHLSNILIGLFFGVGISFFLYQGIRLQKLNLIGAGIIMLFGLFIYLYGLKLKSDKSFEKSSNELINKFIQDKNSVKVENY